MNNSKTYVCVEEVLDIIRRNSAYMSDVGRIHAINAVREATIADVKEVVHSKWTFNRDGSGTCQNCHRTTKNAWDYDGHMRYCPDCGSTMDMI